MSSPGAERGGSRSLRIGALAVIGALLLAVWLPLSATPASAAEVASASFVLVREGDVVDEDLYVAGERVEIRGTIEGDLVVSAFDTLVVTGTVTGDIVGTARTARIEGTVGGSVRLVAGRIRIAGAVGEDAALGGGPVVVAGTVGGDLLVYATELHVPGSVGRDVLGRAFVLTTVSGTVGRDVRIDTGRLVVRDGGRVEGSIDYRSARPARIEGEVGPVHRLRERPSPVGVRGAWLLVGGIYLVLLYLFGLLAIAIRPTVVERAARRTWWPPFVAPVMAVVAWALPVAVAAAFLSFAALDPRLAAPAAVLGAPFVLIAVGLVAAAATFALIPVAVAIGQGLLSARRSPFARFTLGLLVLLLVGAIPLVGPILLGFAWLAGTGAWFLAVLGRRAVPDPTDSDGTGVHDPDVAAAGSWPGPHAESPVETGSEEGLDADDAGRTADDRSPMDEQGPGSTGEGTEDPGPQPPEGR